MFYTSGWKSGFFTGLITGIVIYAMAKSPRGRYALSKLDNVSGVLKDGVNNLTQQANTVLDSTVELAKDMSRQEAAEQRVEQSYMPAGN